LLGEFAVAGDLTGEIKNPRGRGFVCVFIYFCGRQLFCFREVTLFERLFVWQQIHIVRAGPREYDVSIHCHLFLIVLHINLPTDVFRGFGGRLFRCFFFVVRLFRCFAGRLLRRFEEFRGSKTPRRSSLGVLLGAIAVGTTLIPYDLAAFFALK